MKMVQVHVWERPVWIRFCFCKRPKCFVWKMQSLKIYISSIEDKISIHQFLHKKANFSIIVEQDGLVMKHILSLWLRTCSFNLLWFQLTYTPLMKMRTVRFQFSKFRFLRNFYKDDIYIVVLNMKSLQLVFSDSFSIKYFPGMSTIFWHTTLIWIIGAIEDNYRTFTGSLNVYNASYHFTIYITQITWKDISTRRINSTVQQYFKSMKDPLANTSLSPEKSRWNSIQMGASWW